MSQQALAEQKELQDLVVGDRITLTPRGTDLTFSYPYKGPDIYTNVKEAIVQDNLKPATMAETIYLLHSAFNSGDKYSDEIRDLVKHRYIWSFIRSRHFTNKGVFVYDEDDHEIFGDLPLNQLEQLLGQKEENSEVYSGDRTLRFVPFGYQIEEITPLQLSKNPYMQALAGEKEAYKLAEFSDQHQENISFAFMSEHGNRTTLSTFVYYANSKLRFGHSLNYDTMDGFGFGVLNKTGEASHVTKQ